MILGQHKHRIECAKDCTHKELGMSNSRFFMPAVWLWPCVSYVNCSIFINLARGNLMAAQQATMLISNNHSQQGWEATQWR